MPGIVMLPRCVPQEGDRRRQGTNFQHLQHRMLFHTPGSLRIAVDVSGLWRFRTRAQQTVDLHQGSDVLEAVRPQRVEEVGLR